MATKNYNSRVQMKTDTDANWAKATNFVPLKGEIIVYSNSNKIKIGDGTTKVNNLAFLSDANSWRGIQNVLTSDSTIDSLSAAQGKALKTLVDTKQDKLTAGSNITISNNVISATSGVVVDTELSTTSTNPVQNKVIKAAIPTQTSQLTNNSGFITSSALSNLVVNGNTTYPVQVIVSATQPTAVSGTTIIWINTAS